MVVLQYIKQFLFSPVPVAMAFIGGALIIFWAESIQAQMAKASSSADKPAKAAKENKRIIASVDDLRPLDAFKVGLVQYAALIPGTSR